MSHCSSETADTISPSQNASIVTTTNETEYLREAALQIMITIKFMLQDHLQTIG